MPCNCLPSVTLAIAVTAALVINCPAQEIGSVDLTEITARTEFRRPPATGKANQARGGAGFDDRFNCPHSVSNIAALRTTLVSLDRSSYQVGDEPRFEVTVENLGPIPLRIPFSPQSLDPRLSREVLISQRGWDDQLNFCTGPGLTPEFKLSADSLRAFTEAS
jgi:hypothetical protein